MTEPSPADPEAPLAGTEAHERDSVAFEDPAYRAAVVDLLGAITYGEISAFQRLTDDAKLAAAATRTSSRWARWRWCSSATSSP